MANVPRQNSFVLWLLLILAVPTAGLAADGRFDLTGPRIDVRVTRVNSSGTPVTLPIAAVPNLVAGDRIWLHPDLPETQSVHYLLICVFLRGTTNPPPDDWFIRIETWNRKVREEGAFVTVPSEAQQAVLFLAPETGGDFSTLKSAVRGRPGAFVRASQDLTEASFEQARIEKYLASIRRVPPANSADLEKRSNLLARTLALKPNADCFKRPPDMQFTCLTQTGSQIVLDDGHGQSIVSALSTGPGSDFINAASSTQLAGGGLYSAYVGAVVDLVRILGNIHTAQYQYIPAISFPQADAMNLRLNTPPSFHNPKSVLVIALPAVQAAIPPPLRPADASHITCLLEPNPTLPIEGAPLVFSTDFAHDLVLHLNTPPGVPAEPDIPLVADAYAGGLVLQQGQRHHTPLLDAGIVPLSPQTPSEPTSTATSTSDAKKKNNNPLALGNTPEPTLLTGRIQGQWGFDAFKGPDVPLQQLPGTAWHLVQAPAGQGPAGDLIIGHAATLYLTSTGTACVHSISAEPLGGPTDAKLPFKPLPAVGQTNGTAQPTTPQTLAVTLPLEHTPRPGDLRLAIQQFGQPRADQVSTRTYAEPAHLTGIEMHVGDRSLLLAGTRLGEVASVHVGDLTFLPGATAGEEGTALRLSLSPSASLPPLHLDESLTADVQLEDGRKLTLPFTISAARPALTLLRHSISGPAAETPSGNPSTAPTIHLANGDDLPLQDQLTFTLKSASPFPRNGQVEIETLDGTLRTVLTLAPSGGLLLQDPHTLVATLDPLSSFGPSAFGPLHLRAVFPPPTARHHEPAAESADADKHTADSGRPQPTYSDWLPLATLVRLPKLSQLQCPADGTSSCTLNGSELFLLQSISADPAYADSVTVPDGFTGNSLSLPHVAAQTVFFKLRDDPDPMNSAIFPPPVPVTAHAHRPARATVPTTPSPAASQPGVVPPTPAPTATPAQTATPPAAVPKT